MKIKRQSSYSGITRTIDLPVTAQQMRDYMILGKPIQVAFPHLSASQREFIMTGISDEEWKEIFE